MKYVLFSFIPSEPIYIYFNFRNKVIRKAFRLSQIYFTLFKTAKKN